ncbi:SIMPL domain-containing protein [Hyphococcus flavus]|uniref:SIMPL domain-containing protein n=1 Tax=Hyphococcus flavus TaxID=1866326 RepID=A0AAF0CIG3_9PROT|nr:SIMPL domain-containing protein [Hyphococcus flavus]WDI32832.1 SIMPL domain-containing protein [Hyphococcus flavus]
MKKLCAILLAGMTAGCLPGETPNQIHVEGEAALEVMPDIFEISATIHSRGETHAEVLDAISSTYSDLKEQLPQLEGLEQLALSTSSVGISPVYDYACQEAIYNDEQCPVVAYSGGISITAQGSPTSVAGNALSFMSELGTNAVNFDGFRVSDFSTHQQKAISTAVENARARAETIASASKSSIVGLLKIQIGKGFDDHYFELDNDTIIVTGSRMRAPRVPLDIEPQPVIVQAKIVAAFEIE